MSLELTRLAALLILWLPTFSHHLCGCQLLWHELAVSHTYKMAHLLPQRRSSPDFRLQVVKFPFHNPYPSIWVTKGLLELSGQIQSQDLCPVLLLPVLHFHTRRCRGGLQCCHNQSGTRLCYCLLKCERKHWLTGWADKGFYLFSL